MSPPRERPDQRSRATTPFALSAINLRVASRAPLHQRLYEQLRSAILSGALPAGSRLPPVRALAAQLSVARNTVLAAYHRLQTEKLIESQRARGTRVLRPAAADEPAKCATEAKADVRLLAPSVQAWLSEPPLPFAGPGAFVPRVPDPATWPRASFGRLLAEEAKFHSFADFGTDAGGGHPRLKEALAQFVRLTRGVVCDAEQIVITSGASSSYYLLAKLLTGPGDHVWVEEPEYGPGIGPFQSSGATLRFMLTDRGGPIVPPGPPPARLVLASGECSLVTGVRTALDRRRALAAWARNSDAFVIENDCDWAFAFEGQPLPTLHAIEGGRRTIYTGTFLNLIAPTARLGYVIAPHAIAPFIAEAARRMLLIPHTFFQVALARFLENGSFTAHLARVTALYRRRRALLTDALGAALPGLEVDGGDGGLHVLLRLPDGTSDLAASAAAKEAGLICVPLSRCYRATPAPPQGLLLGYASVPDSQMARNVERLRKALAPLLGR